jgi:hypothetical protein
MGVNPEVMQLVRSVIRDNSDAARAFAAMRQRGLPRGEAEEEIARALLGCLWEASRRLPDRWLAVIQGLERGKSTASLFPDDLYTGPEESEH